MAAKKNTCPQCKDYQKQFSAAEAWEAANPRNETNLDFYTLMDRNIDKAKDAYAQHVQLTEH